MGLKAKFRGDQISGKFAFFTHKEKQTCGKGSGKGEGKRAFLTVMVLYVGGGWLEGGSDRLLVAAGKKDVGGCLPRVPSNLGGTGSRVDAAQVVCLSRDGGREEPTGGWTLLGASPGLTNTTASAAAPSHPHTFPRAL